MASVLTRAAAAVIALINYTADCSMQATAAAAASLTAAASAAGLPPPSSFLLAIEAKTIAAKSNLPGQTADAAHRRQIAGQVAVAGAQLMLHCCARVV